MASASGHVIAPPCPTLPAPPEDMVTEGAEEGFTHPVEPQDERPSATGVQSSKSILVLGFNILSAGVGSPILYKIYNVEYLITQLLRTNIPQYGI